MKCEQVQISLQICTYQLFRASHKNLCLNIYHFHHYIGGGRRGEHWGTCSNQKAMCLHVLGFRRQFISPMKRVGFYSTTRSCLICHCYHLSSFEYECARRGLPTSFGVIIVFICFLHQSVMTITNYWTIDTKEPTNQPRWPCRCDDINVWCFFVMSFRHWPSHFDSQWILHSWKLWTFSSYYYLIF